jgi:restriction system protein
MATLSVIALIVIGGIWFVVWIIDAANRQRLEAKRERLEFKRQREQDKLEDRRRTEEAIRIVGEKAPELAALREALSVLRNYVATANAYRPEFITRHSDLSFRQVHFSFPLDAIFPRNWECTDNGPDPEPWVTTIDNLFVPVRYGLNPIYDKCRQPPNFPCNAPLVSFDRPPPPQHPKIELPRSEIKIDGAKKNFRERLRTLFKLELSQDWKLKLAADQLQNELAEQRREAEQAKDLMDTYIANAELAYRETQKSLTAEFNVCKRNYERESEEQLAPIRGIYKDYSAHTPSGIETHFDLALRTLALPLPPHFPWTIFYDPNERLLQINQRVPAIGDIVVKRADSKRAPAKKDIDNFLRRLVPAVSLHIAQHIAINDIYDDIDSIAVNCWCRYFERTTGQLKNAFVSSIKVGNLDIRKIDIDKADALDAFRALRGAYVYSTEDIVPIEPQIRLDKKDDRFVEGKEVLEGMAQDQNLATMDWEDFEHLIRELFAKEFGRNEGSEVRITRASRDRGVDAVIFDPDPLHGGKYVVQAKRYNNLVDVSAVRDLWGTVMNEGASRGILVTTSKYGRDAYDFVSNKPITLIDGQNLLSLLAKHGFRFKIELV